MTEDRKLLIARLLNSDTDNPDVVTGVFDLGRRENDKPTVFRARDLAKQKAKQHGSKEFLKLYWDCTLWLAQNGDFESFLFYMERNRPKEERFYEPRRKVLKIVVDDLQDILDKKIVFYSLSLPPGTGKSTLGCFFMAYLMGLRRNSSSVASGHSDSLTVSFYKEVLSILTDDERYTFAEIFPGIPVQTNAKAEQLDVTGTEVMRRFPSLTCRSVGGTLTGAVRIENDGILYCDDMIEDLEEALNMDRLQKKYDAYANQLKDRMKMGCAQIMIGTRWSVWDIQGRIERQYAGNPKYRFRVIPALNDKGESNFDYDYGVGFDTAFFEDIRDSIDAASWWAKYMGQPYEREGLLFPEDSLEYYNGTLPGIDPERILAACDVAWGGGDSLSMPVGYVFGDEVYIHDVVFNTGNKNVTRPLVCGTLKRNTAQQCRFEANNGGHEYCDIVDTKLREEGYRMNLSSKPAPSQKSKLGRIIQFAPDIAKFKFRDRKHRSQEYQKFMDELTTFVQTGKSPHDDAPDSLAMLADMLGKQAHKTEVFQRLF